LVIIFAWLQLEVEEAQVQTPCAHFLHGRLPSGSRKNNLALKLQPI